MATAPTIVSPTPTVLPSPPTINSNDVKDFSSGLKSTTEALNAAKAFSNRASGARASSDPAVLQDVTVIVNAWANLLENASANTSFSVANESASIATEIGANLIATSSQAGTNETAVNAALTGVLTGLDRIFAVAANQLNVGQKPVTFQSTRKPKLTAVIAAHNISKSGGLPKQATSTNGIGFTSLNGVLAASGGSGVVLTTFIAIGDDPFKSSGLTISSELVGLTLRRRNSDGSVNGLTVRNLPPEKQYTISFPRISTTPSDHSTVTVDAGKVALLAVNLTQMQSESDAFTVYFFPTTENVGNGRVDVYFVQGFVPTTFADIAALGVSLTLDFSNSSFSNLKLFFAGRYKELLCDILI